MNTLEEVIEQAHEAWINDPDANPHFPEDGEETASQVIANAIREAGYVLVSKPDGLSRELAVFADAVRDEFHALYSGDTDPNTVLSNIEGLACILCPTLNNEMVAAAKAIRLSALAVTGSPTHQEGQTL